MAPQSATARVQMLDNTIHTYDVKVRNFGTVLLHSVMEDLNLLESDYFGIQFEDDGGNLAYLDPLKEIRVQIKNISNTILKFVVKFFPPDPGQVQEEYTRYLFALQVRQDIAAGLLPCNENTTIAMAASIAQADYGDWTSSDCSDLSYLNGMTLLPPNLDTRDRRLLAAISENHRQKAGKTSADADFQLLDMARRLEHYGLRLRSAKDQENTEISLAVAHMGVVVFRGNSRINTFNWSRIRKLSFKKKRFLIKLRTEANQQGSDVGDILVFVMSSRDTCKTFWKLCIEYHAFFRLEVHPEPKPKPVLLKRGSTFRYSGKTQKQLHELVRNSNFRRTTFVRASSRRSNKSSAAVRPHTSEFELPVDSRTPVVENGASGEPTASTQNHNFDYPSPIRPDVEANGQSKAEYSGVSPTDDLSDEGGKAAYMTQESESYKAAQAWQVESENLHSSVASVPVQLPDEPRSPADTQVSSEAQRRQSNQADKETEDETPAVPSPVHLHSGGVQEAPFVAELPSPPTVSPALSPPSAVMSTRGLKSTSSLSDSMRYPSSQAYYMIKEILTTERTYVNDLEVINTGFKGEVEKAKTGDRGTMLPEIFSSQLFGDTSSLVAVHQQFLAQLEDRLSSWEGRGEKQTREQNADDILWEHMLTLKKHLPSIENGESLISSLEEIGVKEPRFEFQYREFEIQKVCYLPFNSFFLKPMQRLVHYKIVLERLLDHHNEKNNLADHSELQKALNEVRSLTIATQERLKRTHNLQKMAQLRRDLIGVDNLLKPNRTFIREGSLYKLSRKGFQQRLFFLFSDCLLYTSKGVTSTNQFKVHAEMPLSGMIIEINEGESAVPNCFSIVSGTKTAIVAAGSQEEMNKWLEDFSIAITKAERDHSTFVSPLTNGGRKSISRLSTEHSSEDGDSSSIRSSTERLRVPNQQRSNATMHVCWHRNTSVSSSDHLISLKNQLSGYLLRKFKNANGWQKLWVVFTNFCLFFYKSHQDESPLASLPLLGYTINTPLESDDIRKDYVFKLQFKTHVYFFRAESQYTYSRWLEVISSATVTAQRTRLFSRMDSNQ